MSTLALALHSERADGLAAGGVRAEASHRWSSVRGWERAYRVDADVEVTPLAANDRPLALFAIAQRRERPDLPRPELRVMAGLRFSQPLRLICESPSGGRRRSCENARIVDDSTP